MHTIQELLHALWQQDFVTLSDPKLVWTLYGVLFVILVLENGLLPAAFLPGDSLLILTGVLIAKGAMNFPLAVFILTCGASIGCWIGYVQGRWLGNSKTVQGWLLHLPTHYHQRAHQLFHRHGLSALLVARFLAFVRTILPTIAGLSGLSSSRFQLFNWLSGFLWVMILTSIGYAMSKTPLFIRYEDELVYCLMILPVLLLLIGLTGSIWVVLKRRNAKKAGIPQDK